jgi:CheY-like chemotaxis protein
MAHAVRTSQEARRVLLADDEDMVRATLRLILKMQGYHVTEAVDGEDAVRKYVEATLPFDVVLMDLDMPKLSGHEALQQIKRYHAQAKAIFLTGGATLPAGCEDTAFLQKPFDNQQLLELVAEMSEGV